LFERAFDEELRICWMLYCERPGFCRVLEYLKNCTPNDRDKVLARMKEFARNGNWNARVGFIKRLTLSERLNVAPIFEVKSFQDRILFLRQGMTAVAFFALQKKDDWSKKDQNQLEAAVEVAKAALKALGGSR
jgi:hypothetical protein